jgi:O-antigen ligase
MLAVALGTVSMIIGFMFLTPVGGRFASTSFLEESFLLREDLLKNAFWMIGTHPFFGVGLQNFLQNLPQSLSRYSYFSALQPVHNIYLLVFAQVGIIGGGLFLYFLYKTLNHVMQSPASLWQKAVGGMLVSVLILGCFDHYFLTVQQGMLLFSFIIGLCWSLPFGSTQTQSWLRGKQKMRYNKHL